MGVMVVTAVVGSEFSIFADVAQLAEHLLDVGASPTISYYNLFGITLFFVIFCYVCIYFAGIVNENHPCHSLYMICRVGL